MRVVSNYKTRSGHHESQLTTLSLFGILPQFTETMQLCAHRNRLTANPCYTPAISCLRFATGCMLAPGRWRAYNTEAPGRCRPAFRLSRRAAGVKRRRLCVNELSARALETARSRGATYADVRIVRTERESIQLKNGTV